MGFDFFLLQFQLNQMNDQFSQTSMSNICNFPKLNIKIMRK